MARKLFATTILGQICSHGTRHLAQVFTYLSKLSAATGMLSNKYLWLCVLPFFEFILLYDTNFVIHLLFNTLHANCYRQTYFATFYAEFLAALYRYRIVLLKKEKFILVE